MPRDDSEFPALNWNANTMKKATISVFCFARTDTTYKTSHWTKIHWQNTEHRSMQKISCYTLKAHSTIKRLHWTLKQRLDRDNWKDIFFNVLTCLLVFHHYYWYSQFLRRFLGVHSTLMKPPWDLFPLDPNVHLGFSPGNIEGLGEEYGVVPLS